MSEIRATNALSASAVYEGVVRHRRHAPNAHAFTYRMAQLYLDLDEIEHIFDERWLWSTRQRNVAEFRRSDYLGPADISLSEAVRRRIEQVTHYRPSGPIRLLTHLRYAGVIFNPVSFYYCYEADGKTLDTIVAEITNTPWKERHAYVLPVRHARANGPNLHWDFAKTFHVSPFMPMNRDYAWRFTAPNKDLFVHMDVLRDGEREFDASLALHRRPLCGASLARVLLRYPWMTMQVIGAIHWQALRLWLKRNPVYDHPKTFETTHERDC
ncbi:DUF1365 domain-containing protein [Dyella sp. 2HG41-7]|uniref:DUF1365 domain-containing protein n=1 Tax=Dyella sp. 2HG41-7 TaxID=2883239 RepID=UPI001F1C38C9|nr:DUF1365 domain-containing protein [Dyella sp. 2HG41-7]